MRAVWFAAGMVAILALGTWLSIPNGRPAPRNANQGRHVLNDTDLTHPAVTVEQAVADPNKYQNTSVCLTGYFQQSFEFQALSSQADLPNWTLRPPYVWVDLNVPTRGMECRLGAGNEPSCFGELTLFGIFVYNSSGGFGHLGKYQYQLGVTRASVNRSTGTTTNANPNANRAVNGSQ